MIRYEIKKIFSKTGSKIGLLVLLVTLALTCYFAVSYTPYVDDKGEEHIGISAVRKIYEEKEKWTGLVTEEYLKEVIRKNNRVNEEFPYDQEDVVASDINYSAKQGFYDTRMLINSAFSGFREYNAWRADSISEDEVGLLYKKRVQNLKTWLDSDEAKDQFSDTEKAFLINRYEALETPLYYEPADGWTAALVYAPTIIMMTVLVLGFFISGIFSNEFQWKADAVFFSSKYGRNKGTNAKIAAGLLVITIIYWGMILLYSLVVFGIYGTSGADCAIQTNIHGWKSLYHISFLQEYLATVIGGYVGALFILLLSMLVSAKMHTTILAVTIPFIIVFIQSFLGGFQNLADILGLLPDQLLQLDMAVRTFTIYEIGGKVIGAVPILLTVYPVLCVVMIPLLYRIFSRTQIK